MCVTLSVIVDVGVVTCIAYSEMCHIWEGGNFDCDYIVPFYSKFIFLMYTSD